MSKQANPAMIGGFVLGALTLLVVAILVFGSGAFFQQKRLCVSYFPGTIQGLTIGSRVEFRGVQVGEVIDIDIEYDTDKDRFRIPVHYEIWEDKTRFVGSRSVNRDTGLQTLVEKQGLRAKLQSLSLVTGQYMVALSLDPESPPPPASAEKGVIEIPTIEANRERIAKTLENLDLDQLVTSATEALQAIRELAANEQFPAILKRADATLTELHQLVARVDARVDPLLTRVDTAVTYYADLADTTNTKVSSLADSLEATSEKIRRLAETIEREVPRLSQSATGTIDQAGETLRSVDGLVGRNSQARFDLEQMLKEAAGAARSLRMLADYLEQHPSALIKGK